MSEGRFVLPETETVTMSGEAAKKLIGCGSGDAALVYIYILRAGGRFDLDDCALATGRSPAQIEGAMNVLSRLGLVSREDGAKRETRPVDAEPPKYTSEDISRELENGEAFPQLVGEVQIALGRLLSSDDLIRLFSIYDYNGLPPEVILILVNHCIDEVQRRSGPGRKPTMKYILVGGGRGILPRGRRGPYQARGGKARSLFGVLRRLRHKGQAAFVHRAEIRRFMGRPRLYRRCRRPRLRQDGYQDGQDELALYGFDNDELAQYGTSQRA